MRKRSLLFLVVLMAALAFRLPAHGQLIVTSTLTPNASTQTLTAQCQSKLVGGYIDDYAGVSEVCYVGPQTCPPTAESGVQETKPTSTCPFDIPMQPGQVYLMNSDHYLFFNLDPDNPGDDVYLDPDGFSLYPDAFNCESNTCTIEIDYSGDPIPVPYSDQLVAKTTTDVTSASISPTSVSLYQDQIAVFSSNLASIGTVNWCIRSSASGCLDSGTDPLIQGTLNGSEFTAPENIDAVLPGTEYVCAQDPTNQGNFACASVTLTQLAVTINPNPITTFVGVSTLVTATIPYVSGTISWSWSSESSGLSQETGTDTERSTAMYMAGAQDTTITATVTVTGNGTSLTAWETANVEISPGSESAVATSSAMSISNSQNNGYFLLTAALSPKSSATIAYATWTFSGATSLVSCGVTSGAPGSTEVPCYAAATTTPATFTATACLTTTGKQTFCAQPINVQILSSSPPVITSIQTPYAALGNTVTLRGTTYGPHTVAYGPVGTPLTITGQNFNSSTVVEFPAVSSGEPQVQIISWSPTALVVAVPSYAISGVVLVVNGGTTFSNKLPFLVTNGTYSASCPKSP